jgi:hypothetical protein
MSGHSKGRWEVHEGTSGWLEIIADHGDHIYENIANLSPRNTCGVLEKKANHIANAYLMAAAPDLLRALELIRDRIHDTRDANCDYVNFAEVIANEAIAKAEGK